jgi:hypothetical protein
MKELTFATSKKIFKYFANKDITFERAYKELRALRYSPFMARKHLQDLADKNEIKYSYKSIEELEKLI